MLKKVNNLPIRIVAFFVLLSFLAAIRAFEDVLFYDPFLNYFRGEYGAAPIPSFKWPALILSILLRYGLNMLVSLAMIYTVFPDKALLRFSAILYVVLLVILLAAFVPTLLFSPDCKLAIFYERRFLIQPLFVILFLPAFYYQRHYVK